MNKEPIFENDKLLDVSQARILINQALDSLFQLTDNIASKCNVKLQYNYSQWNERISRDIKEYLWERSRLENDATEMLKKLPQKNNERVRWLILKAAILLHQDKNIIEVAKELTNIFDSNNQTEKSKNAVIALRQIAAYQNYNNLVQKKGMNGIRDLIALRLEYFTKNTPVGKNGATAYKLIETSKEWTAQEKIILLNIDKVEENPEHLFSLSYNEIIQVIDAGATIPSPTLKQYQIRKQYLDEIFEQLCKAVESGSVQDIIKHRLNLSADTAKYGLNLKKKSSTASKVIQNSNRNFDKKLFQDLDKVEENPEYLLLLSYNEVAQVVETAGNEFKSPLAQKFQARKQEFDQYCEAVNTNQLGNVINYYIFNKDIIVNSAQQTALQVVDGNNIFNDENKRLFKLFMDGKTTIPLADCCALLESVPPLEEKHREAVLKRLTFSLASVSYPELSRFLKAAGNLDFSQKQECEVKKYFGDVLRANLTGMINFLSSHQTLALILREKTFALESHPLKEYRLALMPVEKLVPNTIYLAFDEHDKKKMVSYSVIDENGIEQRNIKIPEGGLIFEQQFADGCEFCVMSSVQEIASLPEDRLRNTFVLIQPVAGQPPTELYFVNKREQPYSYSIRTFLEDKNAEILAKKLFPKVENNDYNDYLKKLVELTPGQLSIIAEMTGRDTPVDVGLSDEDCNKLLAITSEAGHTPNQNFESNQCSFFSKFFAQSTVDDGKFSLNECCEVLEQVSDLTDEAKKAILNRVKLSIDSWSYPDLERLLAAAGNIAFEGKTKCEERKQLFENYCKAVEKTDFKTVVQFLIGHGTEPQVDSEYTGAIEVALNSEKWSPVQKEILQHLIQAQENPEHFKSLSYLALKQLLIAAYNKDFKDKYKYEKRKTLLEDYKNAVDKAQFSQALIFRLQIAKDIKVTAEQKTAGEYALIDKWTNDQKNTFEILNQLEENPNHLYALSYMQLQALLRDVGGCHFASKHLLQERQRQFDDFCAAVKEGRVEDAIKLRLKFTKENKVNKQYQKIDTVISQSKLSQEDKKRLTDISLVEERYQKAFNELKLQGEKLAKEAEEFKELLPLDTIVAKLLALVQKTFVNELCVAIPLEQQIDLYAVVKALLEIIEQASRKIQEQQAEFVKSELKKFFALREELLLNTNADYCYNSSLSNQLCMDVAKAIFPEQNPSNILLEQAISKDNVERRGTAWRDLMGNQQLPEPNEFFRTGEDEINLYAFVVERAIHNLKQGERTLVKIWQSFDSKNSGRPLSTQELQILKQKTPALKDLVEYTENLSAYYSNQNRAKQSVFDAFMALRAGLKAGSTDGNDVQTRGTHTQANYVACIAIKKFKKWWFNDLSENDRKKLLKLGQYGVSNNSEIEGKGDEWDYSFWKLAQELLIEPCAKYGEYNLVLASKEQDLLGLNTIELVFNNNKIVEFRTKKLGTKKLGDGLTISAPPNKMDYRLGLTEVEYNKLLSLLIKNGLAAPEIAPCIQQNGNKFQELIEKNRNCLEKMSAGDLNKFMLSDNQFDEMHNAVKKELASTPLYQIDSRPLINVPQHVSQLNNANIALPTTSDLLKNKIENQLQHEKCKDKETLIAEIFKITDNSKLIELHRELNTKKFDYLRERRGIFGWLSRFYTIDAVSGEREKTSHSWACIEQALAAQMVKNAIQEQVKPNEQSKEIVPVNEKISEQKQKNAREFLNQHAFIGNCRKGWTKPLTENQHASDTAILLMTAASGQQETTKVIEKLDEKIASIKKSHKLS